jgi:hypothetical protein
LDRAGIYPNSKTFFFQDHHHHHLAGDNMTADMQAEHGPHNVIAHSLSDTNNNNNNRGYDTMFVADDNDEEATANDDPPQGNNNNNNNNNNMSGGETASSKQLLLGQSMDEDDSLLRDDTGDESKLLLEDDTATQATGDEHSRRGDNEQEQLLTARRRTMEKSSNQASAADTDTSLDEISSFPVLVLMTLNVDGTSPDVRKLIPIQDLTTIQDLHATVLQLAFVNGDTIRLDFGRDDDEAKVAEGSLDKERFIWALLQIHAMLCVSVIERNSMDSAGRRGRMILPPLNVLNLDRAELQYVATVNGFVRKSATFRTLFDRHRMLIAREEEEMDEARIVKKGMDLDEMDRIAYDLIMGNLNMRISLFASEEERKDAEDILNSTEWTSSLNREETAVLSKCN